MPRRPGKRVALALAFGKGAVLAGALALTISAVVASTESAEVATDDNTAAVREVVPPALDRSITEHRCSMTGFGADVLPRSALVEVDGRVKHTTFDEGWAIYTEDRPGRLLAVCIDHV